MHRNERKRHKNKNEDLVDHIDSKSDINKDKTKKGNKYNESKNKLNKSLGPSNFDSLMTHSASLNENNKDRILMRTCKTPQLKITKANSELFKKLSIISKSTLQRCLPSFLQNSVVAIFSLE